MEIEKDFLENHQSKCRCCFKQFAKLEKSIKITKTIETQFFDLTQLKLESSTKKYSQKICQTCSKDLNGFTKLRTEFLTKQKQLYEHVDGKISKNTRSSNQQELLEIENVPLKVEIKMEPIDLELKECSVVIERSEDVKHDDESNDFSPLDQFYESGGDIRDAESNDSDSSVGPFDEFFGSKQSPKKKSTKPKTKLKETNRRKPRVGEVWHHCPHCDKKFYSPEGLKVHIDADHFHCKNIQCSKCDFKTTTPKHLKRHVAIVHEKTKILPSTKGKMKTPCPTCGLLVRRVAEHIKAVHVRPKNFICDHCGYGVYGLNRLRRHIVKHMSKETKRDLLAMGCEICGAILLTKGALKAHIKNVHQQDEDKKFVCFCGRSYRAESYLKVHMMTHEKGPNHTCPICTKKFQNLCLLKRHMEVHEKKGPKEFSCEICGGMYGSEILLQRHKIKHTEPKHECHYCFKKYHFQSFLTRHIKKAHEVQKIQCDHCTKKINVLSMARHVREFHSGLPRADCFISGCKVTFLRKLHLKDHMQRVHKDYMERLTDDEKRLMDEEIKLMKLL